MRAVANCVSIYKTPIDTLLKMSGMDRCHNMIPSMNLRKMWKHLRGRHLKRDRPQKMDSDSVVREMRRNTDMPAPPRSPRRQSSLEYQRDAGGGHRVNYTPTTWRQAVQYKTRWWVRTDLQQPLFDELAVDSRGLDLPTGTREGIKVYKPKRDDGGSSLPVPRSVV